MVADHVGQQFGNYRLVSLLGQGGYAEVYLGQHVRLDLQAAIKVLHTHLTGNEAEHFQQEAQTIAALAHPSIIRVFDYDVQEGVPFLVMDYAHNGSLRRHYPKGSVVPLPEIISSVKQVASALQYAHEQKFIHRDVKPENMLLGRWEEVLLSDFGLATVAHSTTSLSLQETIGTFAYMAPEQIEGHPRAASDQYSLGVVVYEWLCGKRPFEGSITEVMVKHLSTSPPPLREHMRTIPVEIEQVVLRALAKDSKARFASVQDFALALEEACRSEASSRQTLLAPSSVSPAVDRQAIKHNLPASLTPLIGRKQEVASACILLRRPEVRLVTLTGTGGVGKTRLALQVATEALADFFDGVSFVSLAPISDSALVIPTIAQVLDVKESGTSSLLDLLTAFLRDKHLLLCLDNFEQILPAAPHLADLLTRCPHLKLLVTSRAVLHIQGEHEFPVPPLAVPDLTQFPPTDTLSDYAAVDLFLRRAQAVKPTFQLTGTNIQSVAEICVRLDGLPLAIELAAARIKLLSSQALLKRLGQRLQVLTSGARDVPARQQTLRNTITWSYELLNAQEQQLFRRLSVFVGGCTLEAIEAVCAALGDGVVSLLDSVVSLLDKSLLQQVDQEDDEPRLVMLETIREYGLECLETSEEMELTRRAHILYYLALAEEAEPEHGLVGSLQVEWLERLEREHDNLRAAMQWSVEQGKGEIGMETALRLGGVLEWFWRVRGHWSEGRNFLELVLQGSEGVVAPVRAKALTAFGSLALVQGDFDRGEAVFEESLALFRKLADTRGIAFSLTQLGEVALTRSNHAAARSLIEEALALYRKVGFKQGIADSLFYLATVASRQGEYITARVLYEESLAIHRELENKKGIDNVLSQLAQMLFFCQGDPEEVRSLLEESLTLCREVGDKEGIAFCFYFLAQLALSQGDTTTARSLAEECVTICTEVGSKLGIAYTLSLLGRLEARQGYNVAARVLYEESLTLAGKVGDKELIAFDLEQLTGVVATQGPVGGSLAGVLWAARLWGTAETLREAFGMPLPPFERADYEQAVATARIHLGEKAFGAAWVEGRTMTPEQALAVQEPGTIPTPTQAEAPTVPPAEQ